MQTLIPYDNESFIIVWLDKIYDRTEIFIQQIRLDGKQLIKQTGIYAGGSGNILDLPLTGVNLETKAFAFGWIS
jgi:hypothetical protein